MGKQKRKLSCREQIIALFLYIFIAYTLVGNNLKYEGTNSQLKKTTLLCNSLEDNEIFVQSNFKQGWGSSLSINKLSHIKNGNKRRNIGYKYFTWNCDRALLSQNKLADIKIFASRHKPHFMAISEINLKRNENNSDQNSLNILSTDQVHEKFKIEGYRIIKLA